jgi:uncharacterized membrane protein
VGLRQREREVGMIATMKRETVSGAVRQLADEGLVAREQAGRVDARLQELLFPTAGPDAASRVAKIVAWLGGILVAAGILFLIGLNWDHLDKWAKLALVFGGLTGLHVAGWKLQEVEPGRDSSRAVARAPALGCALTAAAMIGFGGAIALVAQIYNLSSHWPNAWLVWWLLDLPFVLIFGSRALLLIVVGLFGAWGVQCVEVFCTDHQIWSSELAHGYGVLALAACTAAGGALARGSRFRNFAPLLGALARIGALGGLFFLSFHDFIHSRGGSAPGIWVDPERLHRIGTLLTPAAAFAVGALVLLLIGALRRDGWRGGRNWCFEPLDAGLILLCGMVLATSDLFLPEAAALLANVMILASVLALIVRGVRLGQVGDVNTALVVFLVTVIARYFEYFAEGFGPAFTFLGAGVLLLGLGGFIERLRRKFVAQARRSQS